MSKLRRNLDDGGVLGRRLRDNSLETHHPIPWKRFDIIFERVHGRKMTPTERNSMPGWVMPRSWHNRGASEVPGQATFHDILDGRLRELAQQLPEPPHVVDRLPSEQIIDAVEDAYSDWGDMYAGVSDVNVSKVWEAIKAWIRTQGIDPETGQTLP